MRNSKYSLLKDHGIKILCKRPHFFSPLVSQYRSSPGPEPNQSRSFAREVLGYAAVLSEVKKAEGALALTEGFNETDRVTDFEQ